MKIGKRVMSAVLTFTLVAGLCACGNQEGKETGSNKTGSETESSLAKQYVYDVQEFDLSSVQKPGDDTYIQDVFEKDGRVYIILQSYNWNSGNDEYTYSLIAVDEDGGNQQSYELQTSTDQKTDSAAAQKDNVSDVAQTEDNQADTEAAEDVVSYNEPAMVTEYDYPQVYEYTGFGEFCLTSDGRLHSTKSYYYEDYSEEGSSIRNKYACAWDLEGNMLWETSIDFLSADDSWFYVKNILPRDDGSVVMLVDGDDTGKVTVDSQGNVSELQKDDALWEIFENYQYAVAQPDGTYLMTYYDDDWTNMYVATVDIENGTKSEGTKLPGTIAYSGMGALAVDDNGDLLYTNNQGLYKYHIGDEEPAMQMSFVNSDLDTSSLSTIVPIDDEHFIGLYSNYDEETYNSIIEGGLFTKVNPEDIPDKQMLVLGCNGITSDVRKRVVDYNKTSDTHRIVIQDYSQYNTDTDYKAGLTQLNNDIISGNMPDILIIDDDSFALDSYISKGLLADIGALIEKDEELSKKEFMENVFDACKVDGKLYEIVPNFVLRTYIGKTSIVGEDGLTMEKAQELLAGMSEDATIFGDDVTRETFMNIVLQMRGSDFVDVSTGKCNFDSDEFIALMEYAKTLPEALADDYYDDDVWYVSYESQYREDRTLLYSCNMSDLQSMVYTINGTFGEDVSYVGFPTPEGNGSVIDTGTTYALAAGSADLDAAWEFMRYYLTDDYQSTLSWQLPVNVEYFEQNAQKAAQKPTYTDGNGQEVESDYTWWINEEEVTLDPLTNEQVEKLENFIRSVDKRVYSNTDIQNIITEEMDAFYQGQKSAKDVAGIIQSRAQIFVNENR